MEDMYVGTLYGLRVSRNIVHSLQSPTTLSETMKEVKNYLRGLWRLVGLFSKKASPEN